MRYISADYIYPVTSEPLKDTAILIDDRGSVQELIPISAVSEPSQIEQHKGIICPGFINTHCHLELTYLKGHISENGGMTGFIGELLEKKHSFSQEGIREAIHSGEEEMIRNGIVAVGDISNTSDSFFQKANRKLVYHTFIEIFSLDPSMARGTMEKGKQLREELDRLGLSSSLTPHAPYTMSEELLRLIHDDAVENKSPISIHNQESMGENELFLSQTGPMFNAFMGMGIKKEVLRKTGLNSLRSTLPYLTGASPIMLVHNTYSGPEDISWAELLVSGNSSARTPHSALFWCTCPNANLYIEGRLPDYHSFIKNNALMTIGTDRLASNHSLSILDEMRTISRHVSGISFQTLLTWATKNGAVFLGLDEFGSIEKGKRPGLNLLKGIDGDVIPDSASVERLL